MRVGYKLRLGLVSTLALACSPACAQSGGDGPSLQVSAGVVYDTNVARSSAASAALRHITPSDTSYSPSAMLNLKETLGRFNAHIKGSAGYNFYQRNTILNREFVDTEVGAGVLVLGCDTSVTGNYARRQSDLGDLAVQVTHNTATTGVVSLNTSCESAVGFAPYVSAQRTWSTQSALKTSDFDSYEVSGGIAYNHPMFGRVALFGDYQSTRFAHRFLTSGTSQIQDGYDFESGGIRYSRNIGTKFDIAASFSYVNSTPRVTTAPSFQGSSYDASLGYHPNSRLQVRLNYSRGIRPSTFLNATYSLNRSGGLSVDYKFTERLNANLHVGQSSQRLSGATLVNHVDLQSQTVDTAGAGANYTIGRFLTLSLTVAAEKRHADIVGYGYSSTRYGITLTATP